MRDWDITYAEDKGNDISIREPVEFEFCWSGVLPPDRLNLGEPIIRFTHTGVISPFGF